jgi:hypothetical protein
LRQGLEQIPDNADIQMKMDKYEKPVDITNKITEIEPKNIIVYENWPLIDISDESNEALEYLDGLTEAVVTTEYDSAINYIRTGADIFEKLRGKAGEQQRGVSFRVNSALIYLRCFSDYWELIIWSGSADDGIFTDIHVRTGETPGSGRITQFFRNGKANGSGESKDYGIFYGGVDGNAYDPDELHLDTWTAVDGILDGIYSQLISGERSINNQYYILNNGVIIRDYGTSKGDFNNWTDSNAWDNSDYSNWEDAEQLTWFLSHKQVNFEERIPQSWGSLPKLWEE